MKPLESVRISWRSIRAHPLRSTLTTLGVIIGVAAVITFMVMGGAFTADIVGDLEEYDEPAMVVMTQTTPPDGFGIMFVDSPIYTEHDLEQLRAIDGVAVVAPLGDIPVSQVSLGEERVTGVIGVEATTTDGFEYDEFLEGEPFADGEREAVVNAQVTHLFEDLEVGDELVLTGHEETHEVTVVGIVEEPEELGGGPTVYVPVDPHYEVTVETPRDTEERAYPSLLVGAEDPEQLPGVQDAVIEYLEEDSDAAELKDDDHEIVAQTVEDAIEQITDVIGQLTIFIAGIAAIALVVGSIGIANIMIVSVTERTREIGIMKAVGARKRDVLQLFVVESVILGVLGAIFGVALGLGAGYALVAWIGWPMVYPLDWVAIAIAVGIGVGVVSGLYPAWRAARVDPIEALRHE